MEGSLLLQRLGDDIEASGCEAFEALGSGEAAEHVEGGIVFGEVVVRHGSP